MHVLALGDLWKCVTRCKRARDELGASWVQAEMPWRSLQRYLV